MLCKILIINMLDYKFKRFIFNIKLTVCFIATSCVAIPIKETTKVFAELKYTKKTSSNQMFSILLSCRYTILHLL